jgi:phosphatidylethanolamine-binding protein (PEBP) family uncharacterized protein
LTSPIQFPTLYQTPKLSGAKEMKLRFTLALTLCLFATAAFAADLSVKLGAGWNGKTIPAGQHCKLFGGQGATPPMSVSGIPAGTEWLLVEFNDRDYQPLATRGGHGSIGFPVNGASAKLPAIAENATKLPGGIFVYKKARSSGKYASKGYLPPCSGGAGNRYFADIHAMQGKKTKLASARIELGKY